MAKVRKRHWTNNQGIKKATWTIDYQDSCGNRIRTGGFNTKVEAENALAKAMTQYENSNKLQHKRNIVFKVVAKDFIDYHAATYCKESTQEFYGHLLNKHLLPSFGKFKVSEITPNLISKFIKIKLNDQLAPKTINHLLTLFGSILQKLVDEDVIQKNPVKKVRKLKLPQTEMKFLSHNEIHAVLNTARTYYPNFYPLLLMAITTGMRRGELLALTWDKINWVNKNITVNQSYSNGRLTTPKTNNSIRKVDMTDYLIKVLKVWKLKCPVSEFDLVFPNSCGNYLDPNNMIKRQFEPTLRKAGINRIRFHDLRHTYVAILISENVPLKHIQSQMGHGSIQVTLDLYGHLMPVVKEKSLEVMDNFLNSKFETTTKDSIANYS